MAAFKLSDWNAIIQRINALATNPDAGCNPVTPLTEVTDPHKWSKADIQQARDKLTEICSTNVFSAVPDLWKQSVVDEINAAITQGWCDCCEDIPCEFGQIIAPGQLVANIPVAISFECPGDGWVPGCTRYPMYNHFFDWAPVVHSLQIGQPGYCGRYWSVQRYNNATHEETGSWIVFPTGNSGLILCDGNIRATMDTAGNRGMGLDDHPEAWTLKLYGRCAQSWPGQPLQQLCTDCTKDPNCTGLVGGGGGG